MLRLQNSKWQDWNYASLMDFSTFAVETFDVTMHWADVLTHCICFRKTMD